MITNLLKEIEFFCNLVSGFKNDVGSSKPIAAVTKPKPVGSGLGRWSMAKSKAPQKKTIPVPRKAPSADLFSTIFATKSTDTMTSAASSQTSSSSSATPRSIVSDIFEKKETSSESSTSDVLTNDVDVSAGGGGGAGGDGSNVGGSGDTNTLTITKVFDFAGEAVE